MEVDLEENLAESANSDIPEQTAEDATSIEPDEIEITAKKEVENIANVSYILGSNSDDEKQNMKNQLLIDKVMHNTVIIQ